MCSSETAVKVVVWLLNIGLIAASVHAILNWSAFVWIVGSAGIGTFVEILGIVCIVYIVIAGVCLLPFEKRLRMSYLQLREASCCRCTAILASVLLFTFFLTLGLIALLPSRITEHFSTWHSNQLFAKADTNHDHRLDFHEFSQYTLALQSFQVHQNDTQFRSLMSRVFDAMDKNGDGFVTQESMNAGVAQALWPARERFGIAMTAIAGVVAVFSLVFWCWYSAFRRAKIERDMPQERGEDEALVGSENDADFLPDNLDAPVEVENDQPSAVQPDHAAGDAAFRDQGDEHA